MAYLVLVALSASTLWFGTTRFNLRLKDSAAPFALLRLETDLSR
jgi:hypothetical protein